MREGRVQIYTGDGKGKTTAALGLALRAAGHGMKVCFCQFMKGRKTGEMDSIAKIPEITLKRTGGLNCIRRKEVTEEHRRQARQGLDEAEKLMGSGEFDVVVLDEINVAVHFGLLSVDEVLKFIETKPEGVELVLTGRRAAPELIEKADLVTEMREVKHYYQADVPARKGIEF